MIADLEAYWQRLIRPQTSVVYPGTCPLSPFSLASLPLPLSLVSNKSTLVSVHDDLHYATDGTA